MASIMVTQNARAIEADNDPLEYPWRPPSSSILVAGLDASGKERILPLNPLPHRRLGFAHVRMGEQSVDSFDTVSKLHNQLWADYRYPVVAVGSNASPDVMLNKFRRRNKGGSLFFPIVKAKITGMGIGYFADAAPRGYIAATPYHAPGKTTSVWVSWLSENQFHALNSTEPGYTCRLVSSDDYPLEVVHIKDDGSEIPAEQPAHYYLYDADAGYIVDPKGEPVSLTTQVAIHEKLIDWGLELKGSHADIVKSLAVPAERERLRDFLRDAGLVHDPDIIGEPLNGAPIPYGAIASLPYPEDQSRKWLRVKASRDDLDRSIEQHVVINPSLASSFDDHVGVVAATSNFYQPYANYHRPSQVAHLETAADISEDQIELDQAIRDGLGVAVNEYVSLVPARIQLSPFSDLICPRRYFVVRAQTADHTNLETNIALVSSLTLAFLGIDNGDVIAIEGVADSSTGEVPVLRMRAVAMDDEVMNRRREVVKSATGLYADSRYHLGIHPDIPPILIDRSARIALNIADDRLVPVRIRASRRTKIISELRELMLILFIAFIGIISLIPDAWVALACTGLLCILALWLTISRVRSRIGTVDY